MSLQTTSQRNGTNDVSTRNMVEELISPFDDQKSSFKAPAKMTFLDNQDEMDDY